MGILGGIFTGCVLGVGLAIVINYIIDCCGGISMPGTQDRRDLDRDLDAKIEAKRANGDFKHSKQELQDHWDQYHQK